MHHTLMYSTAIYCKSLTDWRTGTRVACSSNLNLANLIFVRICRKAGEKSTRKTFLKAGRHWSTGSLLSSFCQRTELCPLIQRWKSIHLDKEMIQHDMIWAKKQHIKMYITTYYPALLVFRPLIYAVRHQYINYDCFIPKLSDNPGNTSKRWAIIDQHGDYSAGHVRYKWTFSEHVRYTKGTRSG